MSGDAIGVLEAAYHFDTDEDTWLRRLFDAVGDLGPTAEGVLLYEFDAADGVSITPRVWRGVGREFVDATVELNNASSDHEVRLFYHSGVLSGTVSEMLRASGSSLANNETYQHSTASRGFADAWGLTVSGPEHRGLAFNAPLDRPRTLPPAQRRRWLQVGAHIQAAFRLRRHLTAMPEAVMAPSGEVVHAEPPAQARSLRDRLTAAAVTVERARTSEARCRDGSGIDTWRALVAGRWTLIETFERDGRRYYVAYPNAPHVRSLHALSPREQQVVAYVAQGDSNKWISYQLDITTGAVSNTLSRALAKLGLSSRRELIWMYNHLVPANSGTTSPK